MNRQLLTPIAIVIAGSLVGAGLYFGLRGRDGGAPHVAPGAPTGAPGAMVAPGFAPPPVAGAAPAAAPIAPGGAMGAAPSPNGAATAKTAVEMQVADWLVRQKATLARGCLPPDLARTKPGTPVFRMVMNITVAPDGTQLARGFTEDREANVPGVSECVSRKLEPIRIAPPGVATYLELPLSLP